MDNSVRTKLEQRILDSFDKIELGTLEHLWISEKPFEEFTTAWNALMDYYENEQDTTISIPVLATYLEQTDILRKVWERQDVPLEERQKAWRAKKGMEIKMWKIIQAVVDFNPEDSEDHNR